MKKACNVILGLCWLVAFTLSSLIEHPVANTSMLLQGMTPMHLLGTDSLGRDLFLRLLLGTQNTLVVSLLALLLSFCLAVVAGWLMTWNRFFEGLMGSFVGAFQVMPSLIWVLLFSALLKDSFLDYPILKLVFILGACNWTAGANLVANQIRITRVKAFVVSAQAIGANSWQILLRHIWPNIKVPILTHGVFLFSSLIIQESSISFLGMGLEPPQESWGSILLEGWRSLSVAPHLVLGPTLFLFCANLSLQYFLEQVEYFKENFREFPQQ